MMTDARGPCQRRRQVARAMSEASNARIPRQQGKFAPFARQAAETAGFPASSGEFEQGILKR